MATYYVDFVNGADANNGLGPDASHVSNKPWKTIAKLLGASGMASGDTAYLSPAGPFREVVTVAMTSAVAETKIIGDPANAQGFKTSGGVLVAPGPVRWTAYTTDDKTAASANATLTLSARDFLTFDSIWITGGAQASNTHCVDGTSATSTNIKFVRCIFSPGKAATAGQLINYTALVDASSAITFDQCVFYSLSMLSGSIFNITLPTSASADYSCGILIENCLSLGGSFVTVVSSGANSFKGGGGVIRNCWVYTPGRLLFTNSANLSTSLPWSVTNCFTGATGSATLQANTSGQITEDYNLLACATPRTNVTAGTHSIAGAGYDSSLVHFGQEWVFGMNPRRFSEPWATSPLLGFGNDGTQTSYDLRGWPRPAGGASASPGVGAMERSNTWAKETGTVRTGSNALSITGPGYQDFDIPVAAASTVVGCYMRYDSTYAGTKPQIQVLNGTECGVADATSSAVTTVNTWEQLSLTIVPTSAGIVTIRLLSSDTNGGGKAFADDFSVV